VSKLTATVTGDVPATTIGVASVRLISSPDDSRLARSRYVFEPAFTDTRERRSDGTMPVPLSDSSRTRNARTRTSEPPAVVCAKSKKYDTTSCWPRVTLIGSADVDSRSMSSTRAKMRSAFDVTGSVVVGWPVSTFVPEAEPENRAVSGAVAL
jgi:hypothetical protein